MDYHPVVKKIIEMIKKNNFWYEAFKHAPVTTSEEAAKIRPGYSLEQGAKAIIVKVYKTNKEEEFAMFVLPGNLRIDSKKIKNNLDIKNFRFANEEEIDRLTAGVKRGGVPPFGNLFNFPLFVDKRLFDHEKIIFNAGDRRFSIAMKSDNYRQLVNPKVVDISDET